MAKLDFAMYKTAYHLQLKGFVVTDFDRNAVDNILEKNQGKHVNMLIYSTGGNRATGLSITLAFKNHGNVAVHFVRLNASTADLFDGFDTITENEIASGAIDAAEGNYMKIDDKITSATLSISPRRIISLWKKSPYGQTLTEIKSDERIVEFCAVRMNKLIEQILGHSFSNGDWCIVTSPKRSHKTRNFASLISARLAEMHDIPFYEDLAECHSKHRVGAVFSFGTEPPKERNVIVYDDFVTTGATMISMRNLLLPLGYNLFFLTSISNKL